MSEIEKLTSSSLVPAQAVAILDVIGDKIAGSASGITALTDNSGGTAGNTIVAVPASYTQADLADQIASLTAKVNEIIAALKAQ